jgi:hypothetical protein
MRPELLQCLQEPVEYRGPRRESGLLLGCEPGAAAGRAGTLTGPKTSCCGGAGGDA